jgi:uncharacterized membrane protein
MHLYSIFKLVHIFAVVVFLGNIITGLFWMKRADKTNDRPVIAFAMKTIIQSDRLFTIPGVLIITIGGFAAAIEGGLPLLRTGWIFWSIVMFSLSGLIYSWKLAPLQKKIFKLVNITADELFDKTLYQSCLSKWEKWGLIALITPVVAMIMMVLKIPLRSVL